MHKEVSQISNLFEDFERNIKFLLERKDQHGQIINVLTGCIDYLSFFKIFIIILVTLGQILLIKFFFKNDKKINFSNPFYDSQL